MNNNKNNEEWLSRSEDKVSDNQYNFAELDK